MSANKLTKEQEEAVRVLSGSVEPNHLWTIKMSPTDGDGRRVTIAIGEGVAGDNLYRYNACLSRIAEEKEDGTAEARRREAAWELRVHGVQYVVLGAVLLALNVAGLKVDPPWPLGALFALFGLLGAFAVASGMNMVRLGMRQRRASQ